MKVLVIGQGGREHAIVRALSLSSSVTEVHVIPGNDGMLKNALCHKLDWNNFESIAKFCKHNDIDFVMVGPDEVVCSGLADYLREHGILVVAPNKEAANLEGSKIFAKKFMTAANIPTAKFVVVENVKETLSSASQFSPPYVLKADGLAAGKGVVICKTLRELESAANNFFEKKIFKSAGERALLEQFTPGWELSYTILTNGSNYQVLPLAQDHKKLLENDEGPNTGGMGTLAPIKITQELQQKINTQIVEPTLQQIQKTGMIYRGVIFFGLMITEQGPSLLEYNCRFGDPETQVMLPLIENDFGLLLKDLSAGKLQQIKISKKSTACVILAAAGYPDFPEKGATINGDVFFETSSSYFIHAGIKKSSVDKSYLTNGGRVLGAVGLGLTHEEALSNAYAQAKNISWQGMQYRKDIGKKITNSSKT